jgi:hypothetical protein
MKAIRQTERAAWNWADAVKEGVELRTGIGPDDSRLLDDPAYAAALGRCSELQRIGEQAARELAGWQSAPAAHAHPTPEAATEIEARG